MGKLCLGEPISQYQEGQSPSSRGWLEAATQTPCRAGCSREFAHPKFSPHRGLGIVHGGLILFEIEKYLSLRLY